MMHTTIRDQPRVRAALHGVRLLVGVYLTISVATLAAIILLRDDASVVNPAVWIRGTIVAATALLMFSCATRAARGSARAYLRLRIVSAVMVVAIAVVIAIPGTFPVWLKIEQGGCGLVLIGVVVLANSRHVRAVVAGRG